MACCWTLSNHLDINFCIDSLISQSNIVLLANILSTYSMVTPRGTLMSNKCIEPEPMHYQHEIAHKEQKFA